MNFMHLKTAVAKQWERMQKYPMFRVDVEKDELWETYINGFRSGDNPEYRKRTEHDCSCCKQFIRTIGGTVAIIDDKLVSVWDVTTEEEGYNVVAKKLAKLVKSKPIKDPFLHYERTAGTDRNFEEVTGERPKTWNHFFVNVDSKFVAPKANIPTRLGEERSTKDVFLRSLREIDADAVQTVLDLIAQNSLYRGAEYGVAVEAFQKMQKQFHALSVADEDNFAWTNYNGTFKTAARIRNTAIGTLLVDLSGSPATVESAAKAPLDLEAAVRKYEVVVAPSNYRRTTALVTPAMIKKAKEKVAELGLTSALERRYATIHDISINNILFADRAARKVINGDAFDDLLAVTSSRVSSKALDKIEEVPIEKFLKDIVPRIDSMEVLVENHHKANLVSLVAPQDATAKPLFKWDNRFSWSYNGEVADAIKERVKKAGGNVEGDLCCRLAWSNYDDLDFHMIEPDGYEISFRTRGSVSRCGGQLDVDMNAGRGQTREPVENIFYGNRRTMKEGNYHLFVHQYAKRETKDVGFTVQFDFLGKVTQFTYDKAVPDNAKITVVKFKYTHKEGIQIIESLPAGNDPSAPGSVVWGIPTQTYHKVNVMMLSPNFWDEKEVGNKHYFFMLDGCKNDGTARGFFNEFLRSDLDQHRKVMEMVGSKMLLENADEQISGLGFSSTLRNTLVARVNGSFTRTIKIVF
jgi:hypothetical protein